MHRPPRTLIVDDDSAEREAVARVLASAGYEVFEAANGADGLKRVRDHRPDLVFLDVVMPDMDGMEVCRAIKADPDLCHTFVVLVSGIQTTPDHQADGLEGGADGYIVRPFSNREFLARAEAMLRIKRAEDGLREALARVRRLEGMIPVCTRCHKVRNDRQVWQEMENYLRDHTDAVLSHCLCPECAAGISPRHRGGAPS